MKNSDRKNGNIKKANKKNKAAFPVFKFIIVVICIVLYGICLYAGISGEIGFLQYYVEKRVSVEIFGYRWTIIGIYAAGGFMICIDSVLDAFHILECRKNHKMLVFMLSFSLPAMVLVILNTYKSSGSFAFTVFSIAIILAIVFAANISNLKCYLTKNKKSKSQSGS